MVVSTVAVGPVFCRTAEDLWSIQRRFKNAVFYSAPVCNMKTEATPVQPQICRIITCYHSLNHLHKSVNSHWKNQSKEETALLICARVQRRSVSVAAGVHFLPLCRLSTEPSLCFHKRLSAASTRLSAPPVAFAAGSEREAKFGCNSWFPWQHFVPPQRIGTGTGLSMSVCRQDLGHALC